MTLWRQGGKIHGVRSQNQHGEFFGPIFGNCYPAKGLEASAIGSCSVFSGLLLAGNCGELGLGQIFGLKTFFWRPNFISE